MTRTLTKLELLHFGLDVGALAALSIWLRPTDGQKFGAVLVLLMLFHVSAFFVLEKVKNRNPVAMQRLERPVSEKMGIGIYNAGMGLWLFIVSLIIVPLLIGSLRTPKLAAIQFTVAAGGVISGWMYRRANKSKSIAPFGVTMALALAVMWIVLFGYFQGGKPS